MIVEYTDEIKERVKRALPNLPPAIFDNPLIKKIDISALEKIERAKCIGGAEDDTV